MRAVIGSALKNAYLPASAHPATENLSSGSAPSRHQSASSAEVSRFRAELEALAGATYEAHTVDDIVGIVCRIVRSQAVARVLAWSDAALGVPGLSTRLEAAGITLIDPQVDQAGARRAGQVAELASATVGLTGSDAALSLTGSIVLTSGPGRPRLASLLTPVHIALVRPSTLVDSLPTLIATRPELVVQGANFVCITGPSRTADIEHTLSRGVHGPGEVHAILFTG
jgi:L-lactate dehydrogenase complex protein LldG